MDRDDKMKYQMSHNEMSHIIDYYAPAASFAMYQCCITNNQAWSLFVVLLSLSLLVLVTFSSDGNLTPSFIIFFYIPVSITF